ncbi:hypothetical protein [Candidatus Albibeggiatoa sp. nov. NOAA]|uniref:hypothetical protein n=1 Tax=Candidatus Albibeggiatoa sp. nov. NOAA TaxID=3162724 RepID=UPI0032F23953|nr:hypothetical protein [Thiotrichaceae bacterium]
MQIDVDNTLAKQVQNIHPDIQGLVQQLLTEWIRQYGTVSSSQADQVVELYPYVYVNDDGSARELTTDEKAYLETPFHPADSGRPYIKSNYKAKDGWGSISGFCSRADLPKHIKVKPK